jgi:hypothetical protein
MEAEIGIPSSLISEPKKDFMSLAKAQLGFMNMFAIPLFRGVADVLPTMQYTIDELDINKALFEKAVADIPGMDEERRKRLTEGVLSPRSMSLAIQPDDNKDSSSGKTLNRSMLDFPENSSDIRQATSSSPDQPTSIPNMATQYKEVNGITTSFDSVADFAASDPFNIHDHENRVIGHDGKQRCSETTEESSSVPYSGDWQSQVTSATTGKMPLSPSTQGTSIISQDSLDHSSSIPTTAITAPEPSNHLLPPLPPLDPVASEEDSNGSTLKPDKSLRKKTSRFRMNALNLFRRHKGAGSPSSTGEHGG